MAEVANYGLKALVEWSKTCVDPGCTCTSDPENIRKKVNKELDPSHQLDKAAFDAIRLDLDKNPITDRPAVSAGDKQRDDGNFDRIVEEAFKAFRDKERAIALNPPNGSTVGCQHSTRTDDNSDTEFWIGGAHLRHHLEFLLALKGFKPCVLFVKYADSNFPLFSTVVIDCLVPIMDRFDLWSYGFRISFDSGSWVFYDARSPKMPLISKAFLVHPSFKKANPATYDVNRYPGVPDSESGEALGYPAPFDDFESGRFIAIRDATELDVLAARGWPEDERCCVQGMAFTCPAGDEAVWKKALDFYRQCHEAAKSVGTEVVLSTIEYPEMTVWLEENPGLREGLHWIGSSPPPPDDEFLFARIMEALSGADCDNMDINELNARLAHLGLRLPVPDEEGEGSDNQG